MASAGGIDSDETTTGQVYAQIRSMIIENRIAPGERVNIDALARTLGVSQTPVREAVRQLEGDHLVVRTAARGYCTTPLLGLDELRELFEFRLLVDLWAVRAAAVNRLVNPSRDLDIEIDRFERAVSAASDAREYLLAHDTYFHGKILAASGNRVAAQAYRGTHGHLHAFRLYPADADGTSTVSEHRDVVRAIAACDADAAVDAMRDHLVSAFHRFAAAFDVEPEALPELRQPEDTALF